MATFTPASDVWTLGYDQFGKSCWQNKQTHELRYNQPGEGLALPPRSLTDAPLTGFPNNPPFTPAAAPHAEAFPTRAGLASAPLTGFPNSPPFTPATTPHAEAFPTRAGLASAPLTGFPNSPPFTPAAIPCAETFPTRAGLASAPLAGFPNRTPFNPDAIPSAVAFPMQEGPASAPHPSLPNRPPFSAAAFPVQGLDTGVQVTTSAFKAPQASSARSASVKIGDKPGPISRAEEAKQWSLKRDDRGEYYLNNVTGETQTAKPDCLKKYTSRR